MRALTAPAGRLDNRQSMEQPKGFDRKPYVVIAGYGLPGRTLVELLGRGQTEYVVIELNPQTCERGAAGGIRFITGSADDPEVLHRADIARATFIALMIPNDDVVLAAIPHIRSVNSSAHIIARCSFTSTGLEALRRGADQSLVAEQVIARELEAIALPWFPPSGSSPSQGR